jgi:hypothetical protein
VQHTIAHTTPATWVKGTRVLVTYSPDRTDRAPLTAEGVIVQPKPRRTNDPGPYRVPWVQVDESPFGTPQDRPFPAHWLTVLETPEDDQ